MDYDKQAWDRLARAVIDRRMELDLTQIHVAQRGGLSLDRVSAIERGEARNLRPRTIKALEAGLDWENGSVRAVLDGGAPTPVRAGRIHRAALTTPAARKLAEDMSLDELLTAAEELVTRVEQRLDERRRRRMRRLWELAREEAEEVVTGGDGQ